MIISVFSPAWFILAALGAALIHYLKKTLSGWERYRKLRAMEGLSLLTALFWLIYKTIMAFDTSFDFQIFNELPLHLCNIGTVLAIVAAWKDSKPLQSFLFFCCTIGAVLACVTPDSAFVGISVFTPRCIGYWLYHMMMIVLPISFVAVGIYEPKARDIPLSLLMLLGIGVVDFVINLILRATVYPDANYCYSFGMPGNPLTEMLMRIIPVPVIYMLPMLAVVGAVNLLMVLPFAKRRV